MPTGLRSLQKPYNSQRDYSRKHAKEQTEKARDKATFFRWLK